MICNVALVYEIFGSPGNADAIGYAATIDQSTIITAAIGTATAAGYQAAIVSTGAEQCPLAGTSIDWPLAGVSVTYPLT